MTVETPPAFDEWCIVELLGRRRLAARVREQTVAGAGFLRLDEPDGRTQLVSPAAVYALHPTTEAVVTAMASQWRTEPIARWELPGPRAQEDAAERAEQEALAAEGRDEMAAEAEAIGAPRYDDAWNPF